MNYVQKRGNYVHGFPERRYNGDLRLSGLFPRGFLYNNGQYPEAKLRVNCGSLLQIRKKACFRSSVQDVLIQGNMGWLQT
jgi:hypothetical protein